MAALLGGLVMPAAGASAEEGAPPVEADSAAPDQAGGSAPAPGAKPDEAARRSREGAIDNGFNISLLKDFVGKFSG